MRTCATLFVAAVVLIAGRYVVATGKGPATPATPAVPVEPMAQPDPAAGKGERAKEFIAAFEAGDAKALAGFWTPGGVFVDQTGRRYLGRAAIEAMYAKALAGKKGQKLTVTVTIARKLGDDVRVEEGVTEVTPADGGPPTSGEFTAVLVRKDGTWYFDSVRETLPIPPTHAEHFDSLAWLIGEWTGEQQKGESFAATYDWAENQNFLVSTFAVTLSGDPVVGGTQWIGWDAAEKRIRSWSFYSGGGFGEAAWTRDGNTWTIKTTARTGDGKTVAVTNVLTRVDDDHATWQATSLTVDGKPLPATPAVKLKRVKNAP